MTKLKKCSNSILTCLLLSALMVFGCSTKRLTSLRQAQTMGDKKLSYQENYPGEKLWYVFKTPRICPIKKPLQINIFESEKKYNSINKKSSTAVRIVNIYVDFNKDENCTFDSKVIATDKIEIPIDKKRMTHVYLTYEAELQLESGH